MATKKPTKGKQKKKKKKAPAKCRKSVAKKAKPSNKKKSKKASKKEAAKKKASKTGKGKDKPGAGSTGPKKIDWVRAERLFRVSSRYITHEEMVEHLKDRDGNPVECNVSVIHRRASKEKWSDKRRSYAVGATEEFLKYIGERFVLTKRRNMDALERVKDLMTDFLFDKNRKVACVDIRDLLAVMKAEMSYYGEADFTVQVPGKDGSGVEHVKKALLSALKGGKMTREQLRKAVTK